jgi:hypothetical protein
VHLDLLYGCVIIRPGGQNDVCTHRLTFSRASFCRATGLFLLGRCALRRLHIFVRRVPEAILVRAQSMTSYPLHSTISKNDAHHGRMHGVFDERLVCPAIQDVFLNIKACRQFLAHDAHGELAERKNRASLTFNLKLARLESRLSIGGLPESTVVSCSRENVHDDAFELLGTWKGHCIYRLVDEYQQPFNHYTIATCATCASRDDSHR